jgi:hypothetical protein
MNIIGVIGLIALLWVCHALFFGKRKQGPKNQL